MAGWVEHKRAFAAPAAAGIAHGQCHKTLKPVGVMAHFSDQFREVAHACGCKFTDAAPHHVYCDIYPVAELYYTFSVSHMTLF